MFRNSLFVGVQALMMGCFLLFFGVVDGESEGVAGWGECRLWQVGRAEFSDGVNVSVYPVAAWQSAHPHCSVSADASSCGTTPSVTVSGDNCYPGTGTVDIAQVVVVDGGCEVMYLVQAVDGGIYIVAIDPE